MTMEDPLHNNTFNAEFLLQFFEQMTEIKVCSNWNSFHHIYFQIANLFLFLSFMVPNNVGGFLCLRCLLILSEIFFCMWGWTVLCSVDVFVWNVLFILINLGSLMLFFILRKSRIYPKELNMVYRKVFSPLKVSQHQFKDLLKCMKQIKTFLPKEAYAIENVSKVQNLSLLLEGKFAVSQNGKVLYMIEEGQFMDSLEWFSLCTDEFSQVTVTAVETSRVLVWHRDKLGLTIINNEFLQAVFDHILGRDLLDKLIQVSQSEVIEDNSKTENEEFPLLLFQQPYCKSSLSVLIQKQLQNRI